MADNVAITAGAGTTVATDDVAGVHYQITKQAFGALDTATLVTATVGMPTNVLDNAARRIGIAGDATDIGRVTRNFILNTFTAAPVADALQLVEQWYNNAAVAATATPAVVPAGKTLRLAGYRIETKSLATVGSVVMRIRANTAGTVVIGSPIVATASCGTNAGATTVAMTGGLDTAQEAFPEGIDLPAGTGVGFSLAGYGPTGVLTLQGVTRFEVWGYEYTT